MRIVVVGAYGLIGSYVTARLLVDGHDLVGAGRDIGAARRRAPEVSWVEADLRTTSVEAWAALLRGADALVNCAGALQDSPRDDLHAVHLEGVRRLAAACRIAGVRRLVHLSAAGVAAGRGTAFNQTKLAAEVLLAGEDLDWIILRPGLVLAPAAYGGTALLRGLAAFPYVVPAVYPASVVQVVSVEDVAAAVERAVAPATPARVSVDLLHGEVLTFEAMVLELRRWLGLAPARLVPLPAVLARAAARLSDGLAYLGWRSPMRSAALEQLRLGIQGDAGAAGHHLGLTLRSLRQMLNGWPAGVQERWFAKAYFLKPAILAALGLFWFLSGLISLAVAFPEAASVLTLAGVSPPLAKGAVIVGAAVDMALGLAVAVRRWARPALQGMLLVSAAYLLGGTLVQPGLWLDPLGPLLKIVPAALLAAAALALLDER
ncbi:SDR family oxidoreductase [Oleomonas cavernae]|uniref:SDR family oxidoreductase n=1 Tax=Oleomonas cavernae TaxID=2320859 RepID=A0A418WFS1_9PROT|nr:SDR family oxidoreductase [Oleomonas cavernae]RJF88832.1 SDR family oxidoreductase [Oleomonas cavernae]